jgi:hypothetical protein
MFLPQYINFIPVKAPSGIHCTNIMEETSASILRAEETFFNKLHDVSIQKAVLLTMTVIQTTNFKH